MSKLVDPVESECNGVEGGTVVADEQLLDGVGGGPGVAAVAE